MAKVSIIMGIYNCAKTLPEAIDSIIAQTFTDWQLIMCDDGSIDNTYMVAKAYADNDPVRFILLQNEHNMGLNHTLNRCLDEASILRVWMVMIFQCRQGLKKKYDSLMRIRNTR